MNTVLTLRQTVLCDGQLDCGAKLLFVALLDKALSPIHWVRRGTVVVSAGWLEEHLHIPRRSAHRWSRQLERKGYLSIGKQPLASGWSVNAYTINGLTQDQEARAA